MTTQQLTRLFWIAAIGIPLLCAIEIALTWGQP